ncbi:penicillin acylase family protein [candidate division KSB1 bacterium]|nr:penicillin acylase family protein [candidate division KSB1 bacterium]
MRKIIFFVVLGLVLSCVLIWFGGRAILSRSAPVYEGQFEIAAITSPVAVTIDAKGIPQIWAENDADLFFTLGWLHAMERRFQMELVRRLASGEMAEIFGPEYYQTDLMQRKLGFQRRAQAAIPQLTPEVAQLLQKYCDGVNAWQQQTRILPPEFVLLRLQPHAWEPLDCLCTGLYLTWFAHSLMDQDFHYQKLAEQFGEPLKSRLGQPKNWSPATVQLNSASSKIQAALRMGQASNSWAVAPSKSTTGTALHASDPHLITNMMPGFWYLAGLHSKTGLQALGVTFAGVPGVMMGHNGQISWAFTVAAVDLVDYYREQRNPADSLQILTPQGYQKMQIVAERIQVKGSEVPLTAQIWYTPNGVVVESDSNRVLSLKWAGFDFSGAELFDSILKLQHAQNFTQFQKAVTRFGALNVNWIYSDLQGNIGYQLGAPIPIRNYQPTFYQLAGEDSSYRWQGYRRLEETPFVFNPPDSWVASCNNQIVPPNWKYDLPGFYDPYRILRARALLTEKTQLSPSDFANMQMNQVSALALRWKLLFEQGASYLKQNELAQQIHQWDGQMSAQDWLPGLFTYWREFMVQEVFKDELGDEWSGGQTILEIVLSTPLNQIMDDQTTSQVETVNEISARALEIALVKLGQRTYGEICRLTLSHPLSKSKIIDYWLNLSRGPIPVGGDYASLNANWCYYDAGKNEFQSIVGPSMRFILNWAQVDSFTLQTNLGQSGNPFSPHYDDFLEAWCTGERWQVPFTKSAVYARSQTVLRFLPPKKKHP